MKVNSVTMSLLVLSNILIEHPRIAGAFTIQDLTKFIDLVSLLKPTLSLLQPPHQLGPPECLPVRVHDFLKVSLDLDDNLLKLAWLKLRHVAWEVPYSEELVQKLGAKYIQLFLDYGCCRGIGMNASLCVPCLSQLRDQQHIITSCHLHECVWNLDAYNICVEIEMFFESDHLLKLWHILLLSSHKTLAPFRAMPLLCIVEVS